jgi:hypothetical protein
MRGVLTRPVAMVDELRECVAFDDEEDYFRSRRTIRSTNDTGIKSPCISAGERTVSVALMRMSCVGRPPTQPSGGRLHAGSQVGFVLPVPSLEGLRPAFH